LARANKPTSGLHRQLLFSFLVQKDQHRRNFAVFLKYFGGWPNSDINDYFGVKPRMNANERELIEKEMTYAVAGCAMAVLNELGHGQVLNYLKITGIQAGIILNFKHPKLEWKKVVLQER
jgi:hypothetical protein